MICESNETQSINLTLLLQVSQYTFALCSYQDRKSEPNEMMQLDGFTVDYTEPEPGHEGGRVFFNAVKEGETVILAWYVGGLLIVC